MWKPVRVGLIVFVGATCVVGLLIASIIDEPNRLKAELLAKYEDLLPGEFRGGYAFDFEISDRKYMYCRSHGYMVSAAQMAAFSARIKADMTYDAISRPAVPRSYWWHSAPLVEQNWSWAAENRCGDESFRKAIEDLPTREGTIFYLEQGRTGFGNFDTAPQTYFEYLIAVDPRLRRVYTAFWDRDQGG